MRSVSAMVLAFSWLCGGATYGQVTSTPFAPKSAGGPATFVELSPEQTGVTFVQPIDTGHPHKAIYVGGYASPGIAIGDLNGDGVPDLFVSGGPVANRLYIQHSEQRWKFQEQARAAGVEGEEHWAAGATLVDIDHDGDLDIYVCHYDSPNALYVNETVNPRQPVFVERAATFGLALRDASFASAFCDYDRDGDLDVYIAAYQYVNPAGRPAEPPVREQDGRFEVLPEYQKYYGIRDENGQQTFTNVGRRDYLFENRSSSDGVRFHDVTEVAGIYGRGVTNSMVWWDYDQDGFADLYVGHDFKVPDRLYRNRGDGTFQDVVRSAFPHTTWFSMGSEVGDLNNDLRPDLFVSDMAGTTHYRSKVTMGEMDVHRKFLQTAIPRQYMRNALFVNSGTPRFWEAAYLAGLARSDWSWAVKLTDLDSDGRLDVFITNGAARMFNHADRNFTDAQRVGRTQWSLWEDTQPRLEENLAFRNLGELKFERVGNAWGLEKQGMSYAAAYGDLDLDGDQDLVVANLEEPLSLYRNDHARGNAARVQLRGKGKNPLGIGAVVQIRTSGGEQMRALHSSQGFLSCNEPVLHFGLGEAERIESLRVRWPSGSEQEWGPLPVNHLLVVDEGAASSTAKADSSASPPLPWFRASRRFPALRHREQPFDDYERQPLLPYAHSQLGPGLAVADANGDAKLDHYYLGRGRGFPRGVYRAQQGRLRAGAVLEGAEVHEDMGALFFDAEGDGDVDLFVVSGGVECEPGAAELRDRLYLQQASGFQLSPDALPDLRDSGGVVTAADFDRDGDLDLFVGGRVIPGRYPLAPKSRLLENQSRELRARFVEVTQDRAPGLLASGLVTGAVWSDADNDGWVDLLVTHEWGPVKFYRNQLGDQGGRQLVDVTAEAGLAGQLGWWNGIAARDLDHDGDIDYVVTNFGLNTQYSATDAKPELLYYGIFDGTGQPHLLEAKFEGGKCVPRRGLSCSSHAMPFVRDKLKTFHNFGLATLQDIYTPQKLDASTKLACNTLQSGVLINLGASAGRVPQFRFQPLPRWAQVAPAFGAALADVDADGQVDLCLAQNFFSPQVETGRMDGGMTMVLQGMPSERDEVRWRPLGPRESGVLIPGDAKSASFVDINGDGWKDLLVTVNDDVVQAFEAQRPRAHRQFIVRLIGPPGNADCVGARVTLLLEDGVQQTCEVQSGTGYLAQGSPVLSFGCAQQRPQEVRVRWPSGQLTRHPLDASQWAIGIRQPTDTNDD